ncbi:hypothetical protein CP8484711_2044B, partial [Chlamydia psittaci 84-8471/1]
KFHKNWRFYRNNITIV